MIGNKIVTKEAFKKVREKLRNEGKKVVLCHGVFDLLHYGHIEHLQEAKRQGDILVVSVTSAQYVNKGPGRPYFNDQQRMAFLESLEFVNYVVLSEAATVHEIVEYICPDLYVKGQEYAVAENDISGNILSEQEVVEQYGGKIYFTQGAVYSSTKLLNTFFHALPQSVVRMSHSLKEKYGVNLSAQIREIVNDFSKYRVLVVGDIIIDDYVFCKVQGLTSKDAILSTRFDYQERYAGGALAIAKHLANFAGHVTLLSMMGNEVDLKEYIHTDSKNFQLNLIEDERFITPRKLRYLKFHPQREEYEKLFSVNYLLGQKEMREIDYHTFHDKLERILADYDMAVVCDYGHGLIDSQSIQILEKYAKVLMVNCQVNSSNYGMNLITKYKRMDGFVVDEREMKLAFKQETDEIGTLLKELLQQFYAQYGWVTLGANGAIGRNQQEESQIPAVTLQVKDTVGAGDAFYALAALSTLARVPIDLATFLGNLAGALKTNTLGNSQSIQKVDLLKYANTVLNV